MATARMCPYLNFQGNAREAMTFYQGVLGGELSISTFGDIPMEGTPGEIKDNVMHSQLDNETLTFMGSDMPPGQPYVTGTNMTLCLFGTDAGQLKKFFEGLSAGGRVTMPLARQAWGDEYGSFIDKFGIQWMVNIGAEH
jgi:PhnB protein